MLGNLNRDSACRTKFNVMLAMFMMTTLPFLFGQMHFHLIPSTDYVSHHRCSFLGIVYKESVNIHFVDI